MLKTRNRIASLALVGALLGGTAAVVPAVAPNAPIESASAVTCPPGTRLYSYWYTPAKWTWQQFFNPLNLTGSPLPVQGWRCKAA